LRLIAHSLTEENASTRILRKLGFQFIGAIEHPEDGRIWKWRHEVKLDLA
jgi:[ribosomal protein S5]-alanine N-acetyltransferase